MRTSSNRRFGLPSSELKEQIKKQASEVIPNARGDAKDELEVVAGKNLSCFKYEQASKARDVLADLAQHPSEYPDGTKAFCEDVIAYRRRAEGQVSYKVARNITRGGFQAGYGAGYVVGWGVSVLAALASLPFTTTEERKALVRDSTRVGKVLGSSLGSLVGAGLAAPVAGIIEAAERPIRRLDQSGTAKGLRDARDMTLRDYNTIKIRTMFSEQRRIF